MIEVSHLTKVYGANTAVSDLSFTVETGRIYGFLGPNGAGKTTTMNILTGCLAATEGQVLIDGYDIFEDAAKAKRLIGYLPEQPPLYPDMTPNEFLDFVAKAKGVPREKRGEQLSYVKAVTRIEDVADRLIRNLSKGYKQRVGIAQALLGEPEIIILDEPTVGLDPLQIIEIRDLIKELGQKHTVILSSHILSEVRAVCDSIMIISKGRLVACDTPENLETLFRGTASYSLRVRGGEEAVGAALAHIPEITGLVWAPGPNGAAELKIDTDSPEDISEGLFHAFAGADIPILRMAMAQVSLEDVFLELTGDKPQEPAEAAAETPAQTPEADNMREEEGPEDGGDI